MDLVVWGGCLLLFGAGVVWGGGKVELDFFKIASIHDLFDMFSSAATVFVVVFGFQLWRRQVNGQADLDLARKVAVHALRVKEASLEAWMDAQFSINQQAFGPNSLGVELKGKITEVMHDRLKTRESLQIDFLLVLQEARALWGIEFSKKYNKLVRLYFECNRCSRAYLSWVDSSGSESSKIQCSQTIQYVSSYLSTLGFLHAEGRMEKEINHLISDADLAVEKIMRRGSGR